MKKSKKQISAEEFDKTFDGGKEDVLSFFDAKKAKVTKKIKRINIDFPTGFLSELDKEAQMVGVARTALIKLWLAERLQKERT